MTSSTGSALRRTAILTAGTVTSQALSISGQLVLAIWLGPHDYGHFAAASVSLIVCTALLNLGEVNAFITDRQYLPGRLMRKTLRINLCLFAIALVIAGIYFARDAKMHGTLVLILAITLPLTGSSMSLNAISIRADYLRIAVLSQLLGALVKLVVGISVAITTQSPIALALALFAGALMTVVYSTVTLRKVARPSEQSKTPSRIRSIRETTRWATQSASTFIAGQADYAVITVVGSPYVLGIYYLSYQATVGLSALVSGPLMKSSMVELSRSEEGSQETALELARLVSRIVLGVAVLAAIVTIAIAPILPTRWDDVAPVFVVLVGSLVPRIIMPIVEARMLSSRRVRTSTRLNWIDGFGTAVAAVTAATGDPLIVALAVAGWKLAICLLRIKVCFPGHFASISFWPCIGVGVCALVACTWNINVALYAGLAVALAFAGLEALTRLRARQDA